MFLCEFYQNRSNFVYLVSKAINDVGTMKKDSFVNVFVLNKYNLVPNLMYVNSKCHVVIQIGNIYESGIYEIFYC